jgi:hypothetical protein
MIYGETFLSNFKFYAKTLTKLHDLMVPSNQPSSHPCLNWFYPCPQPFPSHFPPPTWIQNRFLFCPLPQTYLPSTRCRTCFPSQTRRTSFPSPTPPPSILKSSSLPKPSQSPKSFLPRDSPPRHSIRQHKLPSHLSDFILG